MLEVFIGYDPREWEAYLVCEASLKRYASEPVRVTPIDLADMRERSLYDRPYRVDEVGQMWDERDKRPFSVAFSFSRFLVPIIAPKGPALFVDCDFVFRRDVAELFRLFDPRMAVQVVKHNHQPAKSTKMDGISQAGYHRKNWSSCILWNVGHHVHYTLNSHAVNTWAGRDLHALKWIPDAYIGSLPEAWNWLADASPTTEDGTPDNIAAIHYTSGGPWFGHMQGCPFADVYREERAAMWEARAREWIGVPA